MKNWSECRTRWLTVLMLGLTLVVPASAELLTGRDLITARELMERAMERDGSGYGSAVQAWVRGPQLAADKGVELPEKIVALGVHLDSRGVGTGALDDGAGIVIVTEEARLILDLHEHPNRSIQVIYFAAEEIGLPGGRAWAEKHPENFANYQIGAESDFDAGLVYEISARVSDEA